MHLVRYVLRLGMLEPERTDPRKGYTLRRQGLSLKQHLRAGSDQKLMPADGWEERNERFRTTVHVWGKQYVGRVCLFVCVRSYYCAGCWAGATCLLLCVQMEDAARAAQICRRRLCDYGPPPRCLGGTLPHGV